MSCENNIIPGKSGNEGHSDNRLRADEIGDGGQFILFEIYSHVVPRVIILSPLHILFGVLFVQQYQQRKDLKEEDTVIIMVASS